MTHLSECRSCRLLLDREKEFRRLRGRGGRRSDMCVACELADRIETLSRERAKIFYRRQREREERLEAARQARAVLGEGE